MSSRCFNQGLNKDLLLRRIIGLLEDIPHKVDPGFPFSRRIPEDDRKKGLELSGSVVSPVLVLCNGQTQKQTRADVEALGIEGNFFESPDQIATNTIADIVQVCDIVEGPPNLVPCQRWIDLGQTMKHLCMTGFEKTVAAVERTTGATDTPDNLSGQFGVVQEGKLFRRAGLKDRAY